MVDHENLSTISAIAIKFLCIFHKNYVRAGKYRLFHEKSRYSIISG